MRERFVSKTFRPDTVAIIETADRIIGEYQRQGFTLTLRQLYYQFVARGLIPNKQSEYKRLGSIVNDARLAGLLDWSAIEDRTRNLKTHAAWGSPESILRACALGYREDPWTEQPAHIEVWIEKDALIGVIEPVCERWRLPYFACRGYASQSEQYRAGKRLRAAARSGKTTIILHLGDHDPSGIDMTRDNQDRLHMFAGYGHVDVRRLALNFDQVEEYSPPPNPAKETDSRAADYIENYGPESWELDALEPTVIDRIIDDAVRAEIDSDAWDAALAQEEERRSSLTELASRWDEVERYLTDEAE